MIIKLIINNEKCNYNKDNSEEWLPIFHRNKKEYNIIY